MGAAQCHHPHVFAVTAAALLFMMIIVPIVSLWRRRRRSNQEVFWCGSSSRKLVSFLVVLLECEATNLSFELQSLHGFIRFPQQLSGITLCSLAWTPVEIVKLTRLRQTDKQTNKSRAIRKALELWKFVDLCATEDCRAVNMNRIQNLESKLTFRFKNCSQSSGRGDCAWSSTSTAAAAAAFSSHRFIPRDFSSCSLSRFRLPGCSSLLLPQFLREELSASTCCCISCNTPCGQACRLGLTQAGGVWSGVSGDGGGEEGEDTDAGGLLLRETTVLEGSTSVSATIEEDTRWVRSSRAVEQMRLGALLSDLPIRYRLLVLVLELHPHHVLISLIPNTQFPWECFPTPAAAPQNAHPTSIASTTTRTPMPRAADLLQQNSSSSRKKLPLTALTTSLESETKTLPEIRFPAVYATREWIEGKRRSKHNKNARRQSEKQNTRANTQ